MVTFGALLDNILYALLGRGGVRERASLGTMLNPEKSPVLQSQESFLSLLEAFMPRDAWPLCVAADVDFADLGHRAWARQHGLVSSAGVFFYFEFVWSGLLYNVAQSALPGTQ